jgi:hypothetical protein
MAAQDVRAKRWLVVLHVALKGWVRCNPTTSDQGGEVCHLQATCFVGMAVLYGVLRRSSAPCGKLLPALTAYQRVAGSAAVAFRQHYRWMKQVYMWFRLTTCIVKRTTRFLGLQPGAQPVLHTYELCTLTTPPFQAQQQR